MYAFTYEFNESIFQMSKRTLSRDCCKANLKYGTNLGHSYQRFYLSILFAKIIDSICETWTLQTQVVESFEALN